MMLTSFAGQQQPDGNRLVASQRQLVVGDDTVNDF